LSCKRLVVCAIRKRHQFQLRKRGIEAAIILADTFSGLVKTLIRNVALVHDWLERTKGGQTFKQITHDASIF
jgi:hypothetical protein